MKLTHTDIDNINRLSLSMIEKYKVGPEKALQKLEDLHLSITGGSELAVSLPLQAALLTVVNTGKRAFLGGVSVCMPEGIPCLINWPGVSTLNEAVLETGGDIAKDYDPACQQGDSILLGEDCPSKENDIRICCNNWQGGILTDGASSPFKSTGTIPTAGIFAGAFAVSCLFFKKSGIDITACDNSSGISLWRPDLHWLDPEASGPTVQLFPSKYWLLGLGHLGQAYAWNIGLLPVLPNQMKVILHDYDRMVPANQSAGLLSEPVHKGCYKTRLCADWLENRGIATQITERRFDQQVKRVDKEPFVALCGFDSAASRLHLEKAGFDLVVEAGLGSNLATFDRIASHTFPGASKTPEDIWGDLDTDSEINADVLDVLGNLDADEKCGIVSRTISGKAVSASFVGACCGALVIAELLRALHNGVRYDKITVQLRYLKGISTVRNSRHCYNTELGRNGFIKM